MATLRTTPTISGTDLPNATQYAGLINADNTLRAEIWSELVKRDARDKNIFKMFIGGEGSGKPIAEKRDLAAGGADKVTFTTVAPIRGQGRLGENELKGNTDSLEFGTFGVEVDLLRHAVSWTQVLKLLRFTGKTVDQLSAQIMSDWYGHKEQDDIQVVLRNSILINHPQANVIRVGNYATDDEITQADKMDTDTIELGKQQLISQGGEELQLDTDRSGAEIPQFLFFGPDVLTRGLRQNTAFLQQLREAGVRGDGNEARTGKFPLWDNNIIFNHNIRIDTAKGRQGSPLSPRAYLGAPLVDDVGASKAVTGGGARNSAGTDTVHDFFANFRGYNWAITSANTNPYAESSPTTYAIIYNLTGADAGKYEVVTVTANDGNKLTVTRFEHDTDTADGALTEVNFHIDAAGKFSNAHPSGSLIIPCNKHGVPLAYGLHMGANALYYGKGAIDMEQIFHYDDFANAGNQAHLQAVGVQGVRGFSPYQDTTDRYPNCVLVVGAAYFAGLSFVDVHAVI
jgi:hypothetical protein